MGAIQKVRDFASQIIDGASRAVASFSERVERNRSPGLSTKELRRLRAMAAKAGVGERFFSTMLRGSGGYAWPGGWSQNRISQCLSFRLWTFVSIRRVMDKIASLSPRVAVVHAEGVGGGGRMGHRPQHRHIDPYRKALYGQYRYRKSNHAIKPHEEVEDVGADHPLVRLLARPNPWDASPGQLWSELTLFLELTGNSYLWVVPSQLPGRDGVGLPCELWVIPSQWVHPRFGPVGITHYDIWPYQGGIGGFKLPPEEVIHFQYKNPNNKVDGLSPQSATAEWHDVSTAIFQSWFWQFQNGCFSSGALQLGPKYSDPDETDIEAIAAKFYARYQGVANTGRPVILPPDAEYVPLTIAPSEMLYGQSADSIRDMILAARGVPKEIAGIQSAGSEIAMYGPLQQFNTEAINPKLRLYGETLTAKLCVRWDDHLRLWWDDAVPENPEQINKDIQTDAANHAIAINQICAIRGREPFDSPLADEPLVPSGLVPLSALAKQLEQQQKQAEMQAQMPQQQVPGQPGAGKEGAPGAEEGAAPKFPPGAKALPHARAKGESYFGECERDELGHCLPSGQGGGKKPEEGGAERPGKEDTAEAERDWKENGVRSKAFKEWFGDWEDDPENASKVVDADGKPLVVYHGTAAAGWESFDSGGRARGEHQEGAVFATDSPQLASDYSYSPKKDPEIARIDGELRQLQQQMLQAVVNGDKEAVAAIRAEHKRKTDELIARMNSMDRASEGAGVYPLYMNLRNPLVVDGAGKHFRKVNERAIAEAKEQGHDGVIIRNVNDPSRAGDATLQTVYVAFEPTQIKSAHNRGTFDPSDANINKAAPPHRKTRKALPLSDIRQDENFDCGAASLRIAAEFLGVKVPHEKAAAPHRNGTVKHRR